MRNTGKITVNLIRVIFAFLANFKSDGKGDVLFRKKNNLYPLIWIKLYFIFNFESMEQILLTKQRNLFWKHFFYNLSRLSFFIIYIQNLYFFFLFYKQIFKLLKK